MKQAIAGVAPGAGEEVTVMITWPSNAAYWLGRKLGAWYAWNAPFGGRVFTFGNLIALATIPLAVVLYFYKLLPYVGTRYRLTNQRVIIERGLRNVPEKWIHLDRFDRVEVNVQPGQSWYDAGDLIFYREDVEAFRLEGVSRPQTFRQCCRKSQMAYTSVKQALERQAAAQA